MNAIEKMTVLGLSVSSSLEGISLAALETDGVDVFDTVAADAIPFEPGENTPQFQAGLLKEFIQDHGLAPSLIGIDESIDAKALEEITKIKTVKAAGSAAFYHRALCAVEPKPMAVASMSAVSTLTFLGASGELENFVAGAGTAAIDDWTCKKAGMNMDYNGKLAATGRIDEKILGILMRQRFFREGRKCADAETFKDKLTHLEGLSLEDGAATATAFVAEGVAQAVKTGLPEAPVRVIAVGGGALNPTLLRQLRSRLPQIEVVSGAELGWKPDNIEAQARAYLAARRVIGLPTEL